MRAKLQYSEYLIYVLVILGFILRINLYFANHSLWQDEAYVALEVIGLSLKEIFLGIRLLPYEPAHPLLFFFIEKTITLLVGNSEYALRLFPLLCSLGSVLFFIPLLRNTVDRKAVLIGLTLFVLCEPVIQFAAESKAYSSDLLMAIILYWTFLKTNLKEFSWGKCYGLALLGSFAMWLSFQSLFILGAQGLIMVGSGVCLRHEGRIARRILIVPFIWALSFITLYFVQLKGMLQNPLPAWAPITAYLPLQGFPGATFVWLGNFVINLFSDLFGFSFPALAAGLCGGLGFFGIKNKKVLFLGVGPLVFALVLSVFHKYPIHGRMVFFAIPMIIIFVVDGVSLILSIPKKIFLVLGAALCALLVLNPLHRSCQLLFNSSAREDTRGIMAFLKVHYLPGDKIAQNFSAQFSFLFYLQSFQLINNFQPADEGAGISSFDGIVFDNQILSDEKQRPYVLFGGKQYIFDQGGRYRTCRTQKKKFRIYSENCALIPALQDQKRVWIWFASLDQEVKNICLRYFDTHGRRINGFKRKGAEIYLYDFSY